MKKLFAKCKNGLRRLHKDRRGLEALEYILVAAFVIGIAFAAFKILGKEIKKGATDVAAATGKAVQSGIQGVDGSSITE